MVEIRVKSHETCLKPICSFPMLLIYCCIIQFLLASQMKHLHCQRVINLRCLRPQASCHRATRYGLSVFQPSCVGSQKQCLYKELQNNNITAKTHCPTAYTCCFTCFDAVVLYWALWVCLTNYVFKKLNHMMVLNLPRTQVPIINALSKSSPSRQEDETHLKFTSTRSLSDCPQHHQDSPFASSKFQRNKLIWPKPHIKLWSFAGATGKVLKPSCGFMEKQSAARMGNVYRVSRWVFETPGCHLEYWTKITPHV